MQITASQRSTWEQGHFRAGSENRGASLRPLSFKTSADQHLGSHLQSSCSVEIKGGQALVKHGVLAVLHEPMNILYRW